MTAGAGDVAAAALVCLPGMNQTRLRGLLDEWTSASAAWAAATSGRARGIAPELRRRWREIADVTWTRTEQTLARRHTRVWISSDVDAPIPEAIPDRPPVLLGEGCDPGVLERPRVAIVGTRAATPHGLADARELGAVLGEAGVTVISGLAIGIDAAAHEGALEGSGGVIGVVATGLDIVYPRRHAVLYDRVRSAGLVLSEQAFGVQPLRHLFPIRNRIIAALADVVVVVEATLRGGARITAQHALDYGRPVLAVPGSRRNVAAEGTNALIADGAHPLVDWGDVLVSLGMSDAMRRGPVPVPPRPAPSIDAATVLHALGGEAATADQLSSRAALAPPRLAAALAELERSGWVERAQGAVWPR